MSFLKKLKSKEDKKKKKIALYFSLFFISIVFIIWFYTSDYSFERKEANYFDDIKSGFNNFQETFQDFDLNKLR